MNESGVDGDLTFFFLIRKIGKGVALRGPPQPVHFPEQVEARFHEAGFSRSVVSDNRNVAFVGYLDHDDPP
jgi:hypothetical protein